MNDPRNIRAITVYCSSARRVGREFFDAARQTGRAIAQRGWTLVYGGNHCGPMGALADAAREAGGRVVGVTPQFLVDRGIADRQCDKLVITADMHQRKSTMAELGDAFVCLPGGIGTLEELMETLAWRELRLHNKPVVLVNIAGYYDALLSFFAHAAGAGFLREGFVEALRVTDNVESALECLTAAAPPRSR